jgi:hypothetical protein
MFSLFLSFQWTSAQELSITKEEIYRNAYKTAVANGTIGSNERAMLNTIQSTLNLSDRDVANIVAQIQLDTGYIDQSGRWLLVFQNMIYGSAIYGWMIPDVLGAKDEKWYIGSEMISLAGSFYLTYIYTKKLELSHSRAQMIRLGSLLGLRYGFGASTIFDLDKNDRNAWELAVMSAIPIGAYMGDRLFKRWQPSHGQSWTLTLGAGVGAFTTMQLHNIFDEMPEEPDCPANMDWDEWENNDEYRSWEKKYDKWRRLNTIIELAGYPVGMYLVRHFWREKSHSVGDAVMLTQGAISGSFYGVMLARLLGADFDNPKWQLFPVTGMTLGAVLMDKYIAGYDYTLGQGVVSTLGTISGISFMAGLSVITEIKDEKVMSALMIAGGISGLYLTNKIFNFKKEKSPAALKEDLSLMVAPSIQVDREKGRTIPGFSLVAIF